MAKQSGIHQINGKVGQMSYYRQKGVASGLIRSINQGMSERVKTEEAYANTRLNNAEFGNACKIASAAFKSVNSRKRGMMRNFAVSAMAKAALEDIKQGFGNWGVRLPATELDSLICDMLEKHAKGGVYDNQFGLVASVSLSNAGAFEITLDLTEEMQTNLKSLGIDGIVYVPSKALAGEQVIDGQVRLFAGNAIGTPHSDVLSPENPITVNISGSVATPASVGLSQSGYTFALEDPNHGFYVCISMLPYREVDGQLYTMQEYCTFVAIPLGQIPEE